MLPDVIGTWKYDGNRGDPGGSGPHDGFGTGAHELQPVTTSATDSVYLVVSEENAMLPTEETTVITPVAPLPQVQSNARTSILVDPTSPTDRRNSKGQVCVNICVLDHCHHHYLHRHHRHHVHGIPRATTREKNMPIKRLG